MLRLNTKVDFSAARTASLNRDLGQASDTGAVVGEGVLAELELGIRLLDWERRMAPRETKFGCSRVL